jgi:hypothetical protein
MAVGDEIPVHQFTRKRSRGHEAILLLAYIKRAPRCSLARSFPPTMLSAKALIALGLACTSLATPQTGTGGSSEMCHTVNALRCRQYSELSLEKAPVGIPTRVTRRSAASLRRRSGDIREYRLHQDRGAGG